IGSARLRRWIERLDAQIHCLGAVVGIGPDRFHPRILATALMPVNPYRALRWEGIAQSDSRGPESGRPGIHPSEAGARRGFCHIGERGQQLRAPLLILRYPLSQAENFAPVKVEMQARNRAGALVGSEADTDAIRLGVPARPPGQRRAKDAPRQRSRISM